MTTLVADADSGRPVCEDCAVRECRPVDGWRCEVDGCTCLCKVESWPDDERARELDDRPPAALANLARDLEAERVPTLDELRAERFGRSNRGRA